MKLCSYVVRTDTGFAPNPFGGFCTLAACTPNRMGLRLKGGDWIMGNAPRALNNVLVYAMRVSEVLDMDDYFHDPRFAAKRPRKGGTWQERCGDNIYFIGERGSYEQAFTYAHTEPHYLEKDTRRPRVFISDHFYYFGENAPPIPAEFSELIRGAQGCQCSHDPEVVRAFVQWLEQSFEPGVRGLPRDRKEHAGASSEEEPRRCAPRPTASRRGPKKDC
jgi:hypothetical protein